MSIAVYDPVVFFSQLVTLYVTLGLVLLAVVIFALGYICRKRQKPAGECPLFKVYVKICITLVEEKERNLQYLSTESES